MATRNTDIDIPDSKRMDPYVTPQYSVGNRIRRQLWNTCWALFYRTSPRTAHGWRAWLLRCFGARLGANCHFYPQSRVWAPWNLECEDTVIVGDRADLYNPSRLYLASHAIISQDAYLCGATHDYNNPAFRVVSYPMRVGRYAWIAARACVSPGVNIGEGAILGLASVATRDLEAWSVYAGMPARKIKDRVRIAE
ncbi:MAG TPA: putative colanic acid biosynthesis acetyltransferase [Acidobacteriaceae bacterium]|jgi:putative colanic acid biosynthesis acetyltransferase WcaF|nr:putative colanic acid biosynthesis acetyltransferase [Acidobacteriaceae bacterium]